MVMGSLQSALNYVTSDKEYKAYYTSGHGESSFIFRGHKSFLQNQEFPQVICFLMTATSIPDDCDLLIIDGATSDFTKDEVKLLSSYLKKGGKVVTLLAQTNKSMKNLYGLLKDYGLTVQSGYIADTERSYQGNYYYLIPNLSVSGDMASGISSNSVMMINSKGMTQSTPVRDSISTDAFMTTSSNGYAVTEKKQTQGTYVLGATSTESVKVKNSKGKKVAKESRLTVYGSNMLIDEQITSSFSSLENLTLFTNSVTACLNNADNVSISPKSLEVSYNTIAHPGPFSILVVFVIPVGLIIGGFIVWFRRRRRLGGFHETEKKHCRFLLLVFAGFIVLYTGVNLYQKQQSSKEDSDQTMISDLKSLTSISYNNNGTTLSFIKQSGNGIIQK